MPIKFHLFRGGVFWVLGGWGSADFIFMGARIFLISVLLKEGAREKCFRAFGVRVLKLSLARCETLF